MKKTAHLMVLMAIVAGLLLPLAASAADQTAAANAPTPGAEVARAVSLVTGVAISPLMGAGAVGAWRFCHAASPAEQAKLPWFAQPWFFVPALIIVSICALKDVFGMSVPVAFKKPFDVLETIEHKVSGLVAAGAFVPLVASVFKDAGTALPPSLQMTANHGFLAVAHMDWLYNGISVPVMLAAYFVVFLASNAINILILLSPFGVVDAALKGFRLLIFSSVMATSLANPWLGAMWALAIIFFAYFIAGWSLRLSHFGMVFTWEICTFTRARFTPDKTSNSMFLARKTQKVPVRTYGKLLRNEKGKLEFHYHPWLILPPRTLELPDGQYAVGKGLLYSEIIRVEGESTRGVMLLPPRYRSHEEQLSKVYGFAGVRPAGLRAAFAWLRERMGWGRQLQPAPVY